MSYSDIKPQSLERSALEKQRFLTTVNKFRFIGFTSVYKPVTTNKKDKSDDRK